MSNLKAARQAIEAELEHARQGVAFYQERIAALEEALSKLESVQGPAGETPAAAKRARPRQAQQTRQAAPGRRGRKPRAQESGDDAALPSTGKDFWPSLITEEPQSAPEILQAAIRTLGITPSKEQLRKLSQRQTTALHNLVKAGVVQDSGSGRERRFFRQQ